MNQPSLDIGILTIRDDEFRAVLHTFARDHGIYEGRYREYTLSTADAGQGGRYRLAILRQIEQGNGEAQEAARDNCRGSTQAVGENSEDDVNGTRHTEASIEMSAASAATWFS